MYNRRTGTSPKPLGLAMDTESNDWYREAVLRPLGGAESHFDSAYSDRQKPALSGACDRLSRTSSLAAPCEA